jgi:hypothetical protein
MQQQRPARRITVEMLACWASELIPLLLKNLSGFGSLY